MCEIKKKTNALESYNLIREIYDTYEFDENEEVGPLIQQKHNFHIQQN